jgi:hypothetical protein
MADDQDRKDFSESEDTEQTTGGQQSHRSEYGEQGLQTDGSTGQPIGGNDSQTGSGTTMSQGATFGGESATGQAQSGSGSEPPRSMGARGTEFGQFGDQDGSRQQGQSGMGQSDLGNQADTTLAGRSDQQDLGQDQPSRVGGATGERGEGFIGSQGSGSDDYLQEDQSASSGVATGGTDFANQGRGAPEEDDEGQGSSS